MDQADSALNGPNRLVVSHCLLCHHGPKSALPELFGVAEVVLLS